MTSSETGGVGNCDERGGLRNDLSYADLESRGFNSRTLHHYKDCAVRKTKATNPIRDFAPDPWFIGSTTLTHCTVDCYMPALGRVMLRWASHSTPHDVHTTYVTLGAHASHEEHREVIAEALMRIDDNAIEKSQ